MKRRGFLATLAVAGAAPTLARANALTQLVAPVTYGLDNPPHFAPGLTVASRARWSAAVAEFLAALAAGTGLVPARQRIATIFDPKWSAADRGLVNVIKLRHPLLEVDVIARTGGARVGLAYKPGLQSPIWATGRQPDWVTYSAVFRDATAPGCRGLIRRFRWLAGLPE